MHHSISSRLQSRYLKKSATTKNSGNETGGGPCFRPTALVRSFERNVSLLKTLLGLLLGDESSLNTITRKC